MSATINMNPDFLYCVLLVCMLVINKCGEYDLMCN